jgi:hypothetical protein
MSLESFRIEIPQETLDDLKSRLEKTRWPDEVEGSGWSMGTNLDYMKELADYWQHKYDWRKHEAKLNKFNQFKTKVDGTEIHFIHERSKNPNATPIILLHGWQFVLPFPCSNPMLADPARYGGDQTTRSTSSCPQSLEPALNEKQWPRTRLPTCSQN